MVGRCSCERRLSIQRGETSNGSSRADREARVAHATLASSLRVTKHLEAPAGLPTLMTDISKEAELKVSAAPDQTRSNP
jgi:hypothetical protein